MSNNRLSCVPVQLKELGCLSSLILTNNHISEFSTELCTVDSHWCGNLRTLDLSGKLLSPTARMFTGFLQLICSFKFYNLISTNLGRIDFIIDI